MAQVNLWQLITRATSDKDDHPDKDRCKEVCDAAGAKASFGTELTLDINPHGGWTVNVFDHNDTNQFVCLSILPSGQITVTRSRTLETGMFETRSVQF